MIVVVPDYRHASPPPIVDGDRVKAPPPELPPPTTRAERWPILACAAVVALAVLLGHLLR
ncbi:hypothetical protein [Micromonospora sp. NPDC047730]|uniref:hypothetical protein n=1 Tax=Micromonospora sp. NPDC047730 TaxID=3364253 RepID=UPI00371CBB03